MARLQPREILLTMAAVAVGSSFAGEPARAAGPGFLSHQALYELSLVKSRGANAVNGVINSTSTARSAAASAARRRRARCVDAANRPAAGAPVVMSQAYTDGSLTPPSGVPTCKASRV